MIKRTFTNFRFFWSRLRRQWQRNDRRYGRKWRLANGAAAVLIVFGAVVPITSEVLDAMYYHLSASALTIVGQTDPALAKQLQYTASDSTYHFNQGPVSGATLASLSKFKQQVGTASGKGGDTSLYGLDVPADFSKGVTYHDTNTQLSFAMAPQFDAGNGRKVDSHLVFPLSFTTRAVYTLKNNGLKEDIVVNKAAHDTMSFAYKLQLPKTLEAHKLADGSIGIYSADPSLYANMSYGGAADEAAIQKARVNGEKDHLVFGLPAPVVKDSKGKSVAEAHFDLDGSDVRVVATGLSDIKGAFSIDPSVVVTSTSDFQTGNNEGMINFGTSGQIGRDGITGGSVGAWTATTSLPLATEQTGAVAYNGYLYEVGGAGNAAAYSAPINTDGTIGAWSTAGTTPRAAAGNTKNVMVYNGYIYDVGDNITYNSVYYARIGGGTIGAWTQGTATPATNNAAGAVIYQHFLYMVGGGPSGGGGSYYTTVYAAPINADGSVGSWQATTGLPTATGMNTALAYNGYLYSIGGADTGFSPNVYYAPINSDGTVGAWATTTSISGSKYGQYSFIYDGYIYYVGGWTNKTTYYAPIYANGSLGSWRTSATMISTSGLRYISGATYNGYIYAVAGREESTSSDIATIQYAKIQPAGTLNSYQSTSSISVAPAGFTGGSAVAYNNCLYELGGYYFSGSNQYSSQVYYASINSDGTVGSWTLSPNSMSAGLINIGTAVAGGNLYVVGGQNASGSVNTVQYTQFATTGCGVGVWQTNATPYVGKVAQQGIVASGGYLYSGGASGAGISNVINSAPINADGSVGSWTQQSSLNTTRNSAGFYATNGYLYVAGGNDGTNVLNSVEYAKITSPGTIGAWQITSSMNNPRFRMNIGVVNGYMYVFGGQYTSGGADQSSTEYARINNDGSLAAWQANTSLGNAVSYYGLASWGNTFYIVTGSLDGTHTQNVEMITANNGGNGQVGAWTSTSSLSTGRSSFGSVAYKGYLYAMGGVDSSSNYLNDVQYAPINSDGTLGAWKTTTSFTTPRQGFRSAAYNGYLYIIGGVDSSNNYLNDVQYAPINSDGTLGAWKTTTSFTTGRSSFSAAASSGYLYVIGGTGSLTNDFSDVQYASINSDGTLGIWKTTTSFTTSRHGHASLVYNGNLYIVGGAQWISDPRGGYRESMLNDVQYAPINSDGTIGVWKTTESLANARAYLGVVAQNGYLYIMGGTPSSSNYLNDVQYASINSDGTLGRWATTTSFATGRYQFGSVAYNGYLYVIGGYNGTGTLSDVQYSPLNSISRTGHYTKLIDLGAPVNITSFTYSGTVPLVGGVIPITFRAAGTDGKFGASTPISGIGGITARYVLVSFTLDDSMTAAAPDYGGAISALADFAVSYAGGGGHPAPAQRLRKGQTLQNGVLSPFDTYGP